MLLLLSEYCDTVSPVKNPKAAFASRKKDFEPILTCITWPNLSILT